MTGLCEMVDVWLTAPMSSDEALCRLRPVLLRDLEATSAEEVDLRAPALQALMRAAEYRAMVHTHEPAEAVEGRIESLLACSSPPRQRMQKGIGRPTTCARWSRLCAPSRPARRSCF